MKKIVYFLLIVVLTTSMLFLSISCKEKAEGTAEEVAEETEETVEEVAEETEETVEEAAIPGEWGNIDWRQFEGTELFIVATSMPVSEVYKEHIGEFEELTGIKVNLELMASADRRKIQFTDFSTGRGLYDVGADSMAYRQLYAESNFVENLDKYLNDPKLTDKEWYNIDDYLPDVIKGGYSKAGDFVAIPFTCEYYLLWYLKDVFDQLGLNPPETWDEYEQVVEAIDNAREAGEIDAYAYVDRTVPTGEGAWSMFCSASRWGLDLINFDEKISNMSTPEVIEFMEFYTSWPVKYGPPGATNWNWTEIGNAFGQGKLAMTFGGNASWAIIEDESKSTVAGKVGYAHCPMRNDGRDILYEWSWMINSDSQNKEASWLFVQWATSPTLMKEIAPQYGVPARASCYSDPAYIEAMPNQEFVDAQLWMMENGINPKSQTTTSLYGEAADILSKEMNNVVADIKDVVTACADADAALAELGYTAAEEYYEPAE